MNLALSTSKIVICYSPQTQQSAFRLFASQKRTTTHSTVYTITNGLPFHELQHLDNYKGPSIPFTNYNTSFLVNPDNKTINPIPTVHTSQTFSDSRHLPLCNRLLPDRPNIHKPHLFYFSHFPHFQCLLSATPYAHADANSRANKSHTTRLDTKFPY